MADARVPSSTEPSNSTDAVTAEPARRVRMRRPAPLLAHVTTTRVILTATLLSSALFRTAFANDVFPSLPSSAPAPNHCSTGVNSMSSMLRHVYV